MDVSLCSIKLRDILRTGNASFSLIYSFQVDGFGAPFEIQRVKDDFIGEREIAKCIERWRLSELKGESKVYAVFRWVHGVGWEYVWIKCGEFEKKFSRKELL
jgi:hypothetical protein